MQGASSNGLGEARRETKERKEDAVRVVLGSVSGLGVGGLSSIGYSATTHDYSGSGGSRARRDSQGGGTIARKNGQEGDASAAMLPAE